MKKAICYFGGAAIIILGGIIVLMAPYNYVGFLAQPGSEYEFEIFDSPGFYNQFTIIVRANAENSSVIIVDLEISNITHTNVYGVSMNLTSVNLVPNSNPPIYQQLIKLEVPPGTYFIIVDRIVGANWIDLSFRQESNSKTVIAIGASLNIIGLVIAIAGYFLPGTFFPQGDERVVGWGYEPKDNSSD